MQFPKELVEAYGAKAGILMYVKEHLPDIPQAHMVVKTPDESIDDFLRRADDSGVAYPRIYRSSAVAELHGYEGDFLTVVVEDFETARAAIDNPHYEGPYSTRERFDAYVRNRIEDVENSTDMLIAEGHNLPGKINVIAAEHSPSLISGTYVKHPNQKGFYLATCTLEDEHKERGAERSSFTIRDGNVDVLWLDHLRDYKSELPGSVEKALLEVIPWHDRIAALPDMDNTWSYQIEFGLFPTCLYQVRPFKKNQFADFEIETDHPDYLDPLVIGTTQPEGLVLRVEKDINLRMHTGDSINESRVPAVQVDGLRLAHWAVGKLPNHQANILSSSHGLLAHNDVKALRSTQVTILYGVNIPGRFETGDMVRITSNGRDFRIDKIN